MIAYGAIVFGARPQPAETQGVGDSSDTGPDGGEFRVVPAEDGLFLVGGGHGVQRGEGAVEEDAAGSGSASN